MGFSSASNPSAKQMEQTQSVGAGCQDSFLPNVSHLTVFIRNSLSY